jgi:hypothetical protein
VGLTWKEFEMLKAITPKEMLCRKWSSKTEMTKTGSSCDESRFTNFQAPNLLRMVNRFNQASRWCFSAHWLQFSRWVSFQVVKEENLKKRVVVVARFLRIAKVFDDFVCN